MAAKSSLWSAQDTILVVAVLIVLAVSIQGVLISDEVRMKLETSYPKLRDNKNWLDPSTLDDADDFVQELIHFFEMGDAEIDLREDETDIVLIVGATGVGKSTLGYVIAGTEENKLTIICSDFDGVCKIVDENGHIGNESIVSQTLLPNLILDENLSPHTAFYDCPGFFDNRNETVEIANSYYMNKVGRHAKRLKILLVTLFTDFSDSNRSALINLFKQIVSLFPHIDQYPESVGLLANRMWESDLTDTHIYNRMSSFLVNKVKAAIESGQVDYPPEHVEKTSLLIDTLVATDQTNSRMWYFPAATLNGSIEDFPKMTAAKENSRNVIWNKTLYYLDPTDSDFGFPLSGNAEAKLLTAAVKLNSQIQELMNDLFVSAWDATQLIYEIIISGNVTYFDDFVHIASNMYTAEYPPYSEFLNIRSFISKVLEITSKYSSSIEDYDTFIRIQLSAEYLTRVNEIRDYSNFTTPDAWTAPFAVVKLKLDSMLSRIVSDRNTEVQQSMDNIFANSRKQLRVAYEEIILGNTTKFIPFVQKASNMIIVEYPPYSNYNDIREFASAIWYITKYFSDPSDESDLTLFNLSTEHLSQILRIHDFFNGTNPNQWVAQFPPVKLELNDFVNNLATNFDGKLQAAASEAATEIGEHISLLIENTNFNNISEIAELEKILESLFAASFPEINDTQTNINFEGFTYYLISEIRSFSAGQSENFLTKMNETGHLLQLLQSVKDVSPFTNINKWVQPFSSILPKITNNLSSGLSVYTLATTNATLHHVALSHFRSLTTAINDKESIQNRKTSAQNKISDLEAAEAEIHKKLLPGASSTFFSIVELYLVRFMDIFPISNEDLNKLRSLMAVIHVLESVMELDYQSGYQWIKPINELTAAVKNELNFLEFLDILFQGLSTSAVHVNKKGDLFAWRQVAGNKPTTLTNLDGLINQLIAAEIILGGQDTIVKVKQHLTSYIDRFEILNMVLEYTIGNPLKSVSCPKVFNGYLLFDMTNYLTMSFVLGCLDGIAQIPPHIVLFGQGKFFLDSRVEMKKYTNNSVTIFLMSLENELQNVEIDLTGMDGPLPNPAKVPGKPSSVGVNGRTGALGGEGSSFMSIYGRQIGNPNILTCGGKGGQGQGGSDGGDGPDGQRKFTSDGNIISTTQCNGFLIGTTGFIAVDIHPNSCNVPNEMCNAGWVILFGQSLPGYLGGRGGAGGLGGQGGFTYNMEVTSTSYPVITMGGYGSNGNSGADGNPGNYGPKGRDIQYLIQVTVVDGGTRCVIREIYEGFRQVDSAFVNTTVNETPLKKIHESTPPVLPSAADQCSSTPTGYLNMAPFKTYIQEFITVARLSLNPFNYERLSKFLTDVDANPNLR